MAWDRGASFSACCARSTKGNQWYFGTKAHIGVDDDSAETINGLLKAKLIHRRAPWKTKEAIEHATLEWVSWFDTRRLLAPIGCIPPAEAEANYSRQLAGQAAGACLTPTDLHESRGGSKTAEDILSDSRH